jgi:metal-sulfur cluster biosynthetic enzyme
MSFRGLVPHVEDSGNGAGWSVGKLTPGEGYGTLIRQKEFQSRAGWRHQISSERHRGVGMAIEREKIMDAIRQCYDPEIPINIVDLGLIYDVQDDEAGNVTVKMTLTTQGCPSAQAIPEQVRSRVAAIEEVKDVKVDIVWEPAWNPSMISPNGRQVLGLEV